MSLSGSIELLDLPNEDLNCSLVYVIATKDGRRLAVSVPGFDSDLDRARDLAGFELESMQEASKIITESEETTNEHSSSTNDGEPVSDNADVCESDGCSV